MSNVLAVQLSEDEATFVTARVESGKPIVLLGRQSVPLTLAAPEEGSPEESEPAPPTELHLPDVEIDSTLGVLDSDKLLYSVLELPFKDPKKIEQVATFQIQDTLPFDLEDFVVDSIVTGEAGDDRFRILASMAPRGDIARSLSFCTALGAEPRLITTGAGALSALALHCHPEDQSLRAYIELSPRRLSLAVLLADQPIHLREAALRPRVDGGFGLTDEMLRSIACSLARVERETEKKIENIFYIGSPEQMERLAKGVPYPVSSLDLSRIVVNDGPDELDLEEVSWSLGLVASELQRSRKGERRLLDFRQGPFAFHRLWQDLWGALQQEIFYIVLAIVLGLVWFGGKIYANASALSRVNDRISMMLEQALPGEQFAYRSEVATLQTKLSALEDELRKLGSLSSLSPLEALQELVTALGNTIDVSLDSVVVGGGKMSLKGSVAENRQIGELSAALNARTAQFTQANVTPLGKTTNGRVRFNAEITLSE